MLDMEAGAGYTTELLARAVGPNGVVYAQDSAEVMERQIKDKFTLRAQKPAMKPVIHVIAALSLAESSKGNAIGVGLADFITRRLRDGIDEQKTGDDLTVGRFAAEIAHRGMAIG